MGRGWRLLGVAVAVSGLVPGAACGGSDDDDGGDGGVDAGSADAATACGAPTSTVTHDATITADETWAGDVAHLVPGDLAVDSATLTIEACAIVSMGAGASITVRGDPGAGEQAALVASGAGPDRKVAFVRADEAEPWGILRGWDDSSRIELHHAELRGGGAFDEYGHPAIAMSGSSYAVLPVGLLDVDHVLIDGPQGNGIYFDTNAAFTDDSTDLTIQGAGDSALVMTMMSVGSIPTGTYAGNGSDEVLVFGQFNVFADLTVPARLPIRIPVGSMVVAAPINETAPVTLTLEPGVELRFPPLSGNPGARVQFGSNGNEPDNKVGVLLAQGTEAYPIVFTSGADTPAAGDWVGLWLDTAPGSRLDHVIIEFAGADSGISSSNCRPDMVSDDAALVVGDFSDQYVPPDDLLTSSIIRDSAGNGINAVWVGLELGPDFTGGGNTISDVAECDQTYNSLDALDACPMQGCF